MSSSTKLPFVPPQFQSFVIFLSEAKINIISIFDSSSVFNNEYISSSTYIVFFPCSQCCIYASDPGSKLLWIHERHLDTRSELISPAVHRHTPSSVPWLLCGV